MDMSEAQFVGSVLAAGTTLMGAYLLTQRVRDAFLGKPEGKLAPATRGELERVRESVDRLERDLAGARSELMAREDGALASVHELIRRNAEHIAVLIAQAEMFDRRITETAQRVDRLGERIGR